MSEEEYAMKYADERRMRIGLERRLHSLMFHVVPYTNVTADLCKSFITKDTVTIAEAMAKLTDWRCDLETNVLINMFRPVGTLDLFTDEDSMSADAMSELPRHKTRQMEELTSAAAKLVAEEWDKFAAGTPIANTAEFKEGHKDEIQALVEEQMAKYTKASKLQK